MGDGSGSLTFSELRRACQKFGWPGDVRALFDCLGISSDEGTSSLTLEEVAFLDKWVEEEPSVEAAKEAQFAIDTLKAKEVVQQKERRPSFLDADCQEPDAAADGGQSPSRRTRTGTDATTASAPMPKF